MSSALLYPRNILRAGIAALASGVVLLTGCSLGTLVLSGPEPASAVVSLNVTGNIHGGQQPVSGSTVQLYAVGSSGYGSAATALGSAVTSSSTGGFTLTGTYTCPATGNGLVYLLAKGGNPGLASGTNNTALVLAAPLGACSGLSASTVIQVNEITTAATAFALGQYFTSTFGSASTDSFGAPASTDTQAQTGIANAFATAANLVNTTTGNAVQTNTSTTSGVGSITITPEYAKLNTIADILASCVNSSGPSSTSCSTLFADVTPSNGTAPTDTLQAAVDMSLNPTSTNGNGSAANMTALYGLMTATPPYVGLGTQPTDWTIGITYGSNSVNAGAGVYLLNYPTYLAVDASGNVWVVNDVTTSATGTTNSLTELGPTGMPIAQALTGSTLIGPAGIAIDPSGNAWIPNYGSASALQTSVVEYTTSAATNTFTTHEGPQRLATDGNGNAFVIEPSYKGLGDLEEIAAGSASGTSAATLATGLTTDFSNLVIDSHDTIWVTGGGTGSTGGTSGYPYVYQFLYSSSSPHYPSTPSATTNAGGVTEPEEAISIDNANNVWVQNYSASTIAGFAGTSTITGATNSPYTTSSDLTKPELQVVDGAGNMWVTDAASTTASPVGSVYEISDAGVTLSPSTGFAHTYDEPYGIAVDPSGNVWVGAYSSSASATAQAFITEIVGAAVPVITPIAAGLPTTPGGTSKLGSRP